MKLRLSALLIALLVLTGLLAPSPALAMDGHDCSHNHAPTLESLIQHVTHAGENGHIDDPGLVTALLAKLQAAKTTLANGQSQATLNTLGAFIAQVQAQTGQHIHGEHDHHLIMHAQHVIAALSS